jgi:hypothetical protein
MMPLYFGKAIVQVLSKTEAYFLLGSFIAYKIKPRFGDKCTFPTLKFL